MVCLPPWVEVTQADLEEARQAAGGTVDVDPLYKATLRMLEPGSDLMTTMNTIQVRRAGGWLLAPLDQRASVWRRALDRPVRLVLQDGVYALEDTQDPPLDK